MADQELQPVNIDVPLFAGQDSSTDPRIVDKGALPLVENGRFYTNGQSQKRYGLTSLSQHDSTGATIGDGQQIFSAGNVLFLRAGNRLYVYNAPNNVWIQVGSVEAASVQNTVMAQSLSDVNEVSSAYSGSAVVIAWREGTSLLVSVYSPLDGIFFQAATQLCTDGAMPQVICPNGVDFYVSYVDNTVVDLKVARIPGTSLGTVGSTISVSNTLALQHFYDICSVTLSDYSPGFAIVTREADVAAVHSCKLWLFDVDLNLVSSAAYTTNNWSTESRMWIFTLSGSDVPCTVFGNASYFYIITNGTDTYDGAVPSGTRRIYGFGVLAGFTSNWCWIERSITALGNTQIYVQLYQVIAGPGFLPYDIPDPASSGRIDASFFTNQNCYLASRPSATGKVWILADFKLQTQLILLDIGLRPLGRALTNGNAAPGDGTFVSLPQFGEGTDLDGVGNAYCAIRRRAQLKFDSNGNVSTTIGIALINLRNDNACVQAVNVGGTTYLSGAAVQLFDGRLPLTELGFWFYSDTPTLTENLGVGALSAGSYSWALCYAWYDNNGKLWRSPVILVAAGNATQPTGASGASLTVSANSSVTIHNITFLQGTLKQNVFIEVYRTKANLTQYYKIAQIANINTLNWLTTTYTDAAADTALTGEILYTDGSQPSYLAPPGFAYLTATPNRLYGLASETNEVWPSALTSHTQPAQFLLGQTLNVPTLNTPPNAVEVLDGNLYIFSEDAILTTGADGQVLSLTQTVQYVPPKALPVDAGCISPGSILRTEDGLWYQSSKGLMLLDRQQGTHFVGEFVKNYRDDIVLAALSMPDQQQLRFVASNQTLVYDYVFKRWSIYTSDAAAVSGCRWRGAYVRVEASGRVRKENAADGLFLDDGTPYSRTIETPWIKAAGLNGYARCWRFAILGEGRAPHRLRVRIAYQYDPAWIDELFIDSTAQNAGGIYGNGLGPYGATEQSAYGASPPASYQFVGVMPRQKATAFKFQITDIDNTGTGEAAALTVLTLQCGVLGGLARLPASKGLG